LDFFSALIETIKGWFSSSMIHTRIE